MSTGLQFTGLGTATCCHVYYRDQCHGFLGDQLLSSIRTQSDSRTISLLKPSRQ